MSVVGVQKAGLACAHQPNTINQHSLLMVDAETDEGSHDTRRQPMKDFLRTLGAGLFLALLMRPPAAWRVRPAAHFWWLLLLSIAVTIGRDWLITTTPAIFYADGLQSDALGALLVLAVAALAAALSARRVLTFSIAVLASAAGLWISLAAVGLIYMNTVGQPWVSNNVVFIVLAAWWLLALRRVLDALLPDWHWSRRGLMAVVAAGITIAPSFMFDSVRYWYPDYAVEGAGYADATTEPAPPRRAPGSAEALMYRQPELVDAALAKLQAGVPGQVDAYLLAFGGDAGEDVFRNEVEYAAKLFEQRFGMAGRNLILLNHPQTTTSVPIASATNLRRALAGIAERMNREEDLLILFMTSHGSADHELAVTLEPLPLDLIDPGVLREALDQSGIQWRVVIVSACYSGGFVEALSSPMSLVLTAASADRTSFGCGSDSEITYFGQAFLVDALNQTSSLTGAFELAREAIDQREREEDFDQSNPQIAAGALIGARLASWERGLRPGPKLAFAPACKQQSDKCRGSTAP